MGSGGMVPASASDWGTQVKASAADEVLITMDVLPSEEIVLGELLYIVDVRAANIVEVVPSASIRRSSPLSKSVT